MTCIPRSWSVASIVSVLVFVGLPALTIPAAAGQGAAAPAGIVGQVTDGTGAVLPGVTVTATSPALQVPQSTTITDAQGDYRLTPLPIGTYTITYELAGFQGFRREGVRLTVSPSISVVDVAARKELHRVNIGPYSRPRGIVYAAGKVYFTAQGYRITGRPSRVHHGPRRIARARRGDPQGDQAAGAGQIRSRGDPLCPRRCPRLHPERQ